ncbi:hypothetical protein AB1N83_011505 [Pleurotus pulmonarius]
MIGSTIICETSFLFPDMYNGDTTVHCGSTVSESLATDTVADPSNNLSAVKTPQVSAEDVTSNLLICVTVVRHSVCSLRPMTSSSTLGRVFRP